MESLVDFALMERYKQVKDLGGRLGELTTLIEWEPFREIVGNLYTNTTEQGGRPNIDVDPVYDRPHAEILLVECHRTRKSDSYMLDKG